MLSDSKTSICFEHAMFVFIELLTCCALTVCSPVSVSENNSHSHLLCVDCFHLMRFSCDIHLFLLKSQERDLFLKMPVERLAKHQQRFSTRGALLCITEQLPTCQSICQLPGGTGQSWLVLLDGGCFQCVTRHDQRSKNGGSSLSSDKCMAAERWTRLQTFRQHHMGCHQLRA